MKIDSNVELLRTVQESNVRTYLPDEITKIITNIVLQRNEHKVLNINSFNSWFYWAASLEGFEYWENKFRYLQNKIYANSF